MQDATSVVHTDHSIGSQHEKRLLSLTIGSALFMVGADATIIVAAVPVMARLFHASVFDLTAIATAYLLASAIFVSASGWISDRIGAKNAFLWSIILFAVFSVGCGLSQSLEQLIGFRFLQGAAGALLRPVGRTVAMSSVDKSAQVRAAAIFTVPALLGPVLGPVIASAILSFASWRWLFFINVPLGLIFATIISYSHIPSPRVIKRFDRVGFTLAAIATASIVLSIDLARQRSEAWAPVLFALSLISFVCLILRSRSTPDSILDFTLFHISGFRTSATSGMLYRFAAAPLPLLLSIFVQTSLAKSVALAGAVSLSQAIGGLSVRAFAAPIVHRFGYKRTMFYNGILSCILVALYAHAAMAGISILLAVALLGGFTRSLQYIALNALTYNDLEPARISSASGLSAWLQEIVQVGGIAAVGLVTQAISGDHHTTVMDTEDMKCLFYLIGGLLLFSVTLGTTFGR